MLCNEEAFDSNEFLNCEKEKWSTKLISFPFYDYASLEKPLWSFSVHDQSGWWQLETTIDSRCDLYFPYWWPLALSSSGLQWLSFCLLLNPSREIVRTNYLNAMRERSSLWSISADRLHAFHWWLVEGINYIPVVVDTVSLTSNGYIQSCESESQIQIWIQIQIYSAKVVTPRSLE